MMRAWALMRKPLPTIARTSERMSYWLSLTCSRRDSSSPNSTACCKARLIGCTSPLTWIASSIMAWISRHAASSSPSWSVFSHVEESTGMACRPSRTSDSRSRRSPRAPSAGSWSRKQAAHCRSCASSRPRSSWSCTARRQRASIAAVSWTHLGSSSSSRSMIRRRRTLRSALSMESSSQKGSTVDSSPRNVLMDRPAFVSQSLMPAAAQRLAAICEVTVFSWFVFSRTRVLLSLRLWKSFSSKLNTPTSKGSKESLASLRRIQ
mmetsp:Transcript_36068/g.92950  ORF Transcript_36068/g.92950 Transcript_36068/m.92950 type:complete len:264 (+) Transcript_36068:776-1567(+)